MLLSARAGDAFREAMKKCSAERIDKNTRESMFAEINNSVQEKLAEQFPEQEAEIGEILYTIEKETMRSLIAKDKIRIDGRTTTEIRPITCEVGFGPYPWFVALYQGPDPDS